MFFGLAVASGILMAAWGLKTGFGAGWLRLLAVISGVYVAISAGPALAAAIPEVSAARCGLGLTLLATAALTVALFYGIALACLGGRLRLEPFPVLFETVFAGGLGFVSGFLAVSFAGFALGLTPVADDPWCQSAGLDLASQDTTLRVLASCCDGVHVLAAASNGPPMMADAMREIILRHGRQFAPPAAQPPDTPPAAPADAPPAAAANAPPAEAK